MVTFENVRKVYGDGHVAVDGFNLEVNEGEFVVLIGPSGCGKTTTLKMVNRLIEPTGGTIYINGRNVRKMDPVKLRREIGYVIQQIGLFPHMTITQNIDLVPRLLQWPEEKRQRRVRELLELVDMDPEVYAHRYPSELSGGQQQRIGVLRALAAEPPLILMDEPFGALDPITRENLQDEMKKLQQKLRKTVLFVTHDMDEAIKLADRIVIMREGKAVQIDAPEEILRHPADEFVASFIGKDRLEQQQELETLDDAMIRKPVTMTPEKGIAEGVAAMKHHRVSTLLITDDDRKLLGWVRVEDIKDKKEYRNLGEIMDPGVPTIQRDVSAREVFYKMMREHLEFLAVVDSQGRLMGLVTRTSMVDALARAVWGGNAS